MNKHSPHILCVNPWIHDFAAYDYWAKPLGLLYIASLLRYHGVKVTYIDCLDRFHPESKNNKKNIRNGRGPYIKTKISKPEALKGVKRNFSRYGIPVDWFIKDLQNIPEPDLIFITSLMTYWYPGVFETIKTVKKIFPNKPVILGGIYATLCTDHAMEKSGAHEIITGPGENLIFKIIEKYTGYLISGFDFENLDFFPYPAFDLQNHIPYVPILSIKGCPFSCKYCVSKVLNKKIQFRNPELVAKEILYWNDKHNVKNFAFYDDALLINSKNHIIPILNKLIHSKKEMFFHTPNAMHIGEINLHIAKLLFKAGFKTIRLGLETTAFNNRHDSKVNEEQFFKAAKYLKEAGFKPEQLGAYLLVGLPNESRDLVTKSIKTVRSCGITPVLSHYSPIPRSELWNQAVLSSRYDLNSDPIFTNNSIFPCQKNEFEWEKICSLKGER